MDRRQKRRMMARKRFFAFTGLTVLLALIIFLVSFGVILGSIYYPTLATYFADNYSIRYLTSEGQGTVQKRFSYDPDFIHRDGNLYMDFSALADLCGFAVSGDFDQRRYLTGGMDGDYLTVNIGTTSVIVSGQPVSLRTPSFLSESGSLYLPCEFVENYFDGISIETDEKNDRLIRIIYDIETGCTLTLHRSSVCAEVAPPD